MARFLDAVKESRELVVDGVKYRFKYNEVRRHIGNDIWSLVARYIDGKWVMI